MRRTLIAAVTAAATSGLAGLTARGTSDSAPTSHVVHLDVIAADARGRSVATLKAADFELRENGVVQMIDAAALADPEGGRLFGIYLDEYHVPASASAAVRDVLTRFVARDLGPRDRVAILKPLDSLLAIHATDDRDEIRQAIASFEGRLGDYAPRTTFERTYVAAAPARIDQMRAQVAVSGLNALAVQLGSLDEGRKALIVVSGGFHVAPHRRGLELLPSVEAIVRAANRYNVSIYAIDPGGAAAASANDGGDDRSAAAASPGRVPLDRATVGALAEQTDGRTTDLGGPDLDEALDRLSRDLRTYYLLTYRTAHPDDGQFRRVEVRVKRAGVRVHARTGYWAPSPDEVLAARLAAEPIGPPKLPPGFDEPWHTSPLIRPWFGTTRGEDGKTRVTFVWEPVPRLPGDRSRRRDPARLVLTARSSDGTPVFEGEVLPTGSAGLEAADGVAANHATFDVPPGRLHLKMAIEDAASQPIDADVREIVVRGVDSGVALGTPEVLRARTARDVRALTAEQDAPPIAARVFSRAEHLIVRVDAYAPAGQAAVTARLLNRTGQPMRAIAVHTAPAALTRHQLDLSLAPLPPGEYQIEIVASAPAGQAKDVVRFRVTS